MSEALFNDPLFKANQINFEHMQIHDRMVQEHLANANRMRDQARLVARRKATVVQKKEEVRDENPRKILMGIGAPAKDQINKWKDFAEQQDRLSLKKIENALNSGELSKEQYWTLRGRVEGIQVMVGEEKGWDEFTKGSHRFFEADQAVKDGKMSLQSAEAFKNGYVEGMAYMIRRGGIIPPPGKNDKYGIGDPESFGDDKKFLIVKDAVRNLIEVKLHPY